MRKLTRVLMIAALMVGIASVGVAGVIDFEDLSPGFHSGDIVYADVTITYVGAPAFTGFTVTSSPGAPLSGNVILGANDNIPGEAYKAIFSTVVKNVSVDMGDFDADYDTLFLRAYDSSDNLLASASALNPWDVNGGLTLSVSSSTAIAYVLFNEAGNGNFETGYPGSIYVDNIRYGVPEPSTVLLLGSGMIGIILARRRSRK